MNPHGSWTPTWSVYSGDCANLTQEVVINAEGEEVPCGFGNLAYQINIENNITHSYYVAVSGLGLIDDPFFSLSAYTMEDCFVCNGEIGNCETTAEFEVVARSFASFDIDTDGDGVAGPFFPNETVSVCIEYFYDSSDTGADWLMGLIPSFGDGWDVSASNIPSQELGGGFTWYADDGDCAPIIQENIPNLCTYIDEAGELQLCNVL